MQYDWMTFLGIPDEDLGFGGGTNPIVPRLNALQPIEPDQLCWYPIRLGID